MSTGPRGGYNFGNKKQYRRTIWRTFRDACVGRLREARGLLMPALSGDEIDVAMQNGFYEENLSICDREPAYVATLKRKYPRLSTFGVEVHRAIARQATKKGTWDVVNLDFTSCLGFPLMRSVLALARSGVMPHGLVAISMLRGREQPKMFKKIVRAAQPGMCRLEQPMSEGADEECQRLEQNDTNDRGRLKILNLLLQGTLDAKPWKRTNMVYLSRFGVYASTAGSQTMLWAVFQIHRQPCLCNMCIFACVMYWQDNEMYPRIGDNWTPSSTLAWLGLEWKMDEQELRDLWSANANKWPREHTGNIFWNEVEFWTKHLRQNPITEPLRQ